MHHLLNTLCLLPSSSVNSQYSYKNIEDDLTESQNAEYGRLTGDVKNWAEIIQN
jgi:hypothetical protein